MPFQKSATRPVQKLRNIVGKAAQTPTYAPQHGYKPTILDPTNGRCGKISSEEHSFTHTLDTSSSASPLDHGTPLPATDGNGGSLETNYLNRRTMAGTIGTYAPHPTIDVNSTIRNYAQPPLTFSPAPPSPTTLGQVSLP